METNDGPKRKRHIVFCTGICTTCVLAGSLYGMCNHGGVWAAMMPDHQPDTFEERIITVSEWASDMTSASSATSESSSGFSL